MPAAYGRRVEQLEIKAGAGIAIRDELRGRLDAYRAKAQAIGLGESPELDGSLSTPGPPLHRPV